MTSLAAAVRVPLTVNRRLVAAGTFILFGLIDILLFGLFAHKGDATFALSLPSASFQVPSIHAPAAPVAYVLGAASVATGVWRAFADPGQRARRISIAVVLLFFVVSLPIEGQLILGAFAAAVVASAFGVLTLGLITGSLAGGLLGAVLAVFAIRYLVDQIILGVVLNVLALGLTSYLYDRILVTNTSLNAALTFNTTKIPGLGDIPIIGPIFFDSNIFLYITYAAIILVQVGLFRTRWGLRVRAVGEHPTAADTVGIRVLATRYRNVIMGGVLAGIGGAWLTVGSVGTFSPGMSAGLGYIGLAAMIFGRWTPLGATAAALLFGFTQALGSVLASINVPIPSDILQMAPYVATIIAVAGLVGRVRAPKADGKPYVKA